jgi:hypothetical protein
MSGVGRAAERIATIRQLIVAEMARMVRTSSACSRWAAMACDRVQGAHEAVTGMGEEDGDCRFADEPGVENIDRVAAIQKWALPVGQLAIETQRLLLSSSQIAALEKELRSLSCGAEIAEEGEVAR